MAQGRGRIFEYAVIYHPRKKSKDEEVKRSEMIVEVTRVIATSDQEVVILASRKIPDTYLDKLDEIEIAVRPF
jgi:hypothetical protein